MREWLVNFLYCPVCTGKLNCNVFQRKDAEIEEAVLFCSCSRWYPVIAGIPKLIWGIYRDEFADFMKRHRSEIPVMIVDDPNTVVCSTKDQVRDTFSAIWDRFPTFGIGEKEKEDFYNKWMVRKLGLGTVEELFCYISGKKNLLEVGVGSGQKIRMMAKHTDGNVIGMDLSSGAVHAYRNTIDLPNVGIVQADLFSPPFREGSFDFIISDGVLHHTGDTKKAFQRLVPLLCTGGEIAIRVYNKYGPIREFCDDYVRSVTTKMNEEKCWEFCKKITKLGQSLARFKDDLVVPEDIEILGIKKGRYNLQRFFYYTILKCFHNPAFSFDENNLVNFDWYHPVDAHRHTVEEVKSWFKEAGLQEIVITEPESGIGARGKKIRLNDMRG